MKKVFPFIILFFLFGLVYATIPGDVDGSGCVNVWDVVDFSRAWLSDTSSANWNPMCDIPDANDGIVNGLDFAVLADHWLLCEPDQNEMAYISSGQFLMGDSLEDSYGPDPNLSDEIPVHLVRLDAFYIGKYEVTNDQYRNFLNASFGNSKIYVSDNVVFGSDNNKRYCNTAAISSSSIEFNGGVFSVNTKDGRDMANDPVVLVSWYGAAAYCNWRSIQDGYHVCYNENDPNWLCDFTQKGYRLPTEAQWEYAAQGGLDGNRFPWNDPNISHTYANYKSTPGNPDYDVSETSGYHPTWSVSEFKPYTAPVGSFASNGYGLFDMAGNAFEWCNDWYNEDYYNNDNSDNNPTGPDSGNWRIIRGGSFELNAAQSRTASRNVNPPQFPRADVGFRVCLNLN